LETLSAEAFIFGNYAFKKGTGVPLPDDDHELPPLEKARKAILNHIQSNYILKSDVEDIIGEKFTDWGSLDTEAQGKEIAKNGLIQDQRDRARRKGVYDV
jgi:hypothetical protein